MFTLVKGNWFCGDSFHWSCVSAIKNFLVYLITDTQKLL